MFVKVWCCLLKKTRKNKTSKNNVWSNTIFIFKSYSNEDWFTTLYTRKKEVKKIFLLLLLFSDSSTKSILVLKAALFYSERFFCCCLLSKLLKISMKNYENQRQKIQNLHWQLCIIVVPNILTMCFVQLYNDNTFK